MRARLSVISSGPSTSREAIAIGPGTTNPPHTTSDSGFTRPNRFELKLANPQEHAASSTQTNPAADTSPPMCQATTTKPAPASIPPAICAGAIRSFKTVADSSNVTKT